MKYSLLPEVLMKLHQKINTHVTKTFESQLYNPKQASANTVPCTRELHLDFRELHLDFSQKNFTVCVPRELHLDFWESPRIAFGFFCVCRCHRELHLDFRVDHLKRL